MRRWVIDGGKALRKAIVECFGATALIQRCQEHKRRNVIDHLPREMHASVNRTLRDAWIANKPELAKKQLLRLAASLAGRHPGAAASLKEGLDETLTVQGLGVTGTLYRTLRTSNPIENLNGLIASYTRNVKRWILLHSDPNTDGGHLMADHLQKVVQDAMARFAERVTRDEAHLSDANSQAKSSDDDIHCTLETRLVGLDAIVVKDHANNAHQAIEGAMRKLKRAVGAELAKRDTRSHRSRAEVSVDDDDSERTG